MADAPRRRRRRLSGALLTALPALLAALPVAASGSASGSVCGSASAVVAGSSDTQAIAYDSSCTARLFEVLTLSDTARSLNLSNLDVERVDSYPSVYTMILNDNNLETFYPEQDDNDMEELYLSDNKIANLSGLRLPLRLSYLDLSGNQIETLSVAAAWPAAGLLQTLILDDNAIDTVQPTAFALLDALQSLSLSNTGLTSLDGVEFPSALTTLNASENLLSTATTNFSTLPTALQHLDLHDNLLTSIPTTFSSLTALISLNLASNAIRSVSNVAFPSTLESLDLSDNPLTMIEVCRSDVPVLQSLSTLNLPSTVSGVCTTSSASVQDIQGFSFCILETVNCPTVYTTGTVSPPSSSSSSGSEDSSSSGSALTDSSPTETSSSFSSEAIGVIGSVAFVLGLVVCGLAFLLYRKRKREDEDKKAAKRRPTRSRGRSNLVSYALELEQQSNTDEGATSDGEKSGWIFDSPQFEPQDKYQAVAILEEDVGHHKRKPGRMDDLLVYEIPPEEVAVTRVLATDSTKSTPRVLLLADYQGFRVVVHALLRQKKPRRRDEKRFLEQIRLASTLEHAAIVHFIGLTYGCSTGDPTNGSSRRLSDRLTQQWTLGVIFEYMALGSLSSMFQAERNRREGKQFYQGGSLSSTIGSGGGNIFSWYPVFSQPSGPPNPSADWRCKLSLALDVAMALVYLHSLGVTHGSLRADKVLVSEHGEAKLSALDMQLPTVDRSTAHEVRDSIRESARRTMRRVVGFVPTHGDRPTGRPTGHQAALTPVTPTLAASPSWRAQKSDVYAFGILLWELDTLISIESMKDLALGGSSRHDQGEQQHQLLKFSGDCPSEIQVLARRCWSPSARTRPDALDLQEELVRVLEGRLTTSSHVPSNWARPTNLSAVSSFSSSDVASNWSARSSELEMDQLEALVMARADV